MGHPYRQAHADGTFDKQAKDAAKQQTSPAQTQKRIRKSTRSSRSSK
jgi:hypothetical protein